MAQTFYQPNYATDRRFAPSGFTIPSGPSIEEQNRMANAPVPVAQGQAAPAKANPMDTLNKTLGLNLGDPYQNSAMKQATDAMPQSDQLANGLRQAGGTAGISRWSTIMQDTGGLPDPTRPDFQQRQQAGIALFNRLQQQGLMDSQPSGFMPPSRDAYMGGGDSVTGQQALAAGGAELSGYGGTRVSGTPGINGGPNRFMLRQNPDTIPAEGSFTPPSNPVQAGPSAYQQSLSRYDAALAAMSKPKDNAPSGYRSNPDGSLSFIPGGPADPSKQAETDRYTRTGPMSRDGKYVGDGAFDKKTGRTGIMVNGELQPLPEGTEPITATGLQKSIPDQKQFRNLKGELTDAEISLRNMDRYIKSVGGSSKGVARLATQFTTGLKTLIGQGLNPQEIATKMANGQMQGLLGANRTNVVGGGVMTEQDALRIIQRLGGDVNALQNPGIVRQAIGEVYSDRYAQYQDSLKFYNSAVGEYYGTKGFKPADEVKFSESFKFEEAPAQPAAPAPAGSAKNPAADILKEFGL